jgi:hypothetical protein
MRARCASNPAARAKAVNNTTMSVDVPVPRLSVSRALSLSRAARFSVSLTRWRMNRTMACSFSVSVVAPVVASAAARDRSPLSFN